MRCRFLLYVLMCFSVVESLAQSERIELLNANVLEYDQSATGKVKRLIGDVRFKQGRTHLFCDSALLYEQINKVEAYGNVRINHQDSIYLYSKKLTYDGNNKMAYLSGDVVMTDNKMTLTTDMLTFNFSDNIGYYTTNGKIINNENTLTSTYGYYFANSKELYFKNNVVLYNSKYKIETDTLKYNPTNAVATFLGPTHIKSEKSKLYCEWGRFNTKTEVSVFSKNAIIQNQDKILKADSIYYENLNEYGKAWGNIEIVDYKEMIVLYGDRGVMIGKQKRNYIYGNAVMKKYMQNDSMYLFADTIYSFGQIDTGKNTQQEVIRAISRVAVLKVDMQARCDSLVYLKEDSTLSMYKRPILWSGNNQATADTIIMYINNSKIDSFRLIENGMMISRVAAKEFDQVKGRIIYGRIKDNKFEYLRVIGNAQSIYYVKEDTAYSGVNVIDCSEMEFYFQNNKISKCNFITRPDATYYPIKQTKPEELRLKGFKWRTKERPDWASLSNYYIKKNR